MITTSFDYDIAMAVGVQEAILHGWIQESIKMSIATNRTDCEYDKKWWCNITKRIEEDFFPFWTHSEIMRFCEALVKKGYATLRADVKDTQAFWITLEASQQKRKRRQSTDKPAVEIEKDEPVNFMKTLDNGMSELVTTTTNKLVAEMIDLFKHVNPSYATFFSRKTEREALKRLIESKVSIDDIFKLIRAIPTTNKMPFAPVITRPSEFERSYPKLVAFIQRHQAEKGRGGITLVL